MSIRLIIAALLLLVHFNIYGEITSDNIQAGTVKNDSAVLKLSKKILKLIKEQDYFELGGYFHPTLGVRFSPYGYIDTASDITFSRKYFQDCFSNMKPEYYMWGYF